MGTQSYVVVYYINFLSKMGEPVDRKLRLSFTIHLSLC